MTPSPTPAVGPRLRLLTIARRPPSFLWVILLLAAAPPVRAQEASFEGLGFLSVDGFGFSEVASISDDGSVVVGVSNTGSDGNDEAFRWSDGSGMVRLGDLPGGRQISRATASRQAARSSPGACCS